MFWKKRVVKPEPFLETDIDVNQITKFCRLPECAEFIKLLKLNRDNLIRVEMSDITSEKTMYRKGQVVAYEQIIANILNVRKEEIVYARKSSEPTK